MKKMTIDNVAELAFVSRSVVSRVLNNHPNVSDEARARVMRVIREHKYSPNSIARSLVTDRTFEICLFAPRWARGSIFGGIWPMIHFAVSEVCLDRGYTLTFSMISADTEESLLERILRSHAFDGCILLSQQAAHMVLPALVERGTPTVCIGHDPLHPEVSSVDVDNFDGAYQAAAHLISLGHERIAAVLGNRELPETRERLRGFRKAFADAGMRLDNDLIDAGDYSQRFGYEVTRSLADQCHPPTAIFFAGDSMAMGGLLALNEAGISVPHDVAIVGFDDLPTAAYTVPPLTTIRQPILEKGEYAANMLFDIIDGDPSEPKHIHLTPELVIRESCGASAYASARVI